MSSAFPPAEGPAAGLAGEVELCQARYFDSLISNEAVRSLLYCTPDQATDAGDLVSGVDALKGAGQSKTPALLPELQQTPAANHIGASVLVLTADGDPLFFQPGITGKRVAGGGQSPAAGRRTGKTAMPRRCEPSWTCPGGS